MALEGRSDAATRWTILKEAQQKRVIAARTRALATQIINEIDKMALLDRAEELEREVAQLEARAASLRDDPH